MTRHETLFVNDGDLITKTRHSFLRKEYGAMSDAESAPAVVGEISELLTWTEICTRCPDEWVCIVEADFVHPTGPEIRTARVVGHGKTRREPFEQARAWRAHYDEIGHYYTGRAIEWLRRPMLVRDGEDWVIVGFRPMLVVDDEIRELLRHQGEMRRVVRLPVLE
jgi:hypothetical protein